MIRHGAALLLFATTVVCAASVAEARTPAKRSGKKDARIEGDVALPGGATVVRVSAIDRDVKAPMIAKEMPVKEYVGRLLAGPARFEINIPPGTYDLHFELKDGLKLEGADMRVGADGDAPALGHRDREAITKRVLTMRTFENEKRVLAIDGAGSRAKALVKLVRTNPTSYDGHARQGRPDLQGSLTFGKYGERVAIFRWEVWSFRKRTGSWVRERKSQILRRFLVPRREMAKVKWDFRPDLGGVDVEAGTTVERDVDLAPPAAEEGQKRAPDGPSTAPVRPRIPHKFGLSSRPGRTRSQIRAIVEPGILTKPEFMQTALELSRLYKPRASGAFLVQFFADPSCLRGWDGTGLLRESDWPHWLCRVSVDTDGAGALYARTLKLGVDMDTGQERTDVLKR